MLSPKVLLVLAGLVALGAAVSPHYRSPYYNQEYYQNSPEYYQQYYHNYPEFYQQYYQNYPEFYQQYYPKYYDNHYQERSLLRSSKSYYPEYQYPEYYPEYHQGTYPGYYPYRAIKSLEEHVPLVKPTTPILEELHKEPTIVPQSAPLGGPATLVM